MRTLFLVIGGLLVAHIVLLQIHPEGAIAPPAKDVLDIGVVFDVGGRGDKSFNDGAYRGAERAIRELGLRVHFVEPGEGSDREA
jgi:basic membrane protein A